MKLLDGGATVLFVIALIYFGEWAFNKAKPEMCGYTVTVEGTQLTKWSECGQTTEVVFPEIYTTPANQ